MNFQTKFYRYNQKTYKVERVDFTQSPETTFDKNGTAVRISLLNCIFVFRSATRTIIRLGIMRRSLIQTSHYSSTKTER